MQRPELRLVETVIRLLWVPQIWYSYWPLGSRIEPLTFCGLNNKSKGIFKMPVFLDPA